jgi:hypothetical protein
MAIITVATAVTDRCVATEVVVEERWILISLLVERLVLEERVVQAL